MRGLIMSAPRNTRGNRLSPPPFLARGLVGAASAWNASLDYESPAAASRNNASSDEERGTASENIPRAPAASCAAQRAAVEGGAAAVDAFASELAGVTTFLQAVFLGESFSVEVAPEWVGGGEEGGQSYVGDHTRGLNATACASARMNAGVALRVAVLLTDEAARVVSTVSARSSSSSSQPSGVHVVNFGIGPAHLIGSATSLPTLTCGSL